MPHKVQTNVANVTLPGVGRIDTANTIVVLTDDAFALIPASAFAGGSPKLTDLGVLPISGDAVSTQAAYVAAAAALTAPTDLGATYSQTNVNALRADVAALQTKLNALLTALQGGNKPMATS